MGKIIDANRKGKVIYTTVSRATQELPVIAWIKMDYLRTEGDFIINSAEGIDPKGFEYTGEWYHTEGEKPIIKNIKSKPNGKGKPVKNV